MFYTKNKEINSTKLFIENLITYFLNLFPDPEMSVHDTGVHLQRSDDVPKTNQGKYKSNLYSTCAKYHFQ